MKKLALVVGVAVAAMTQAYAADGMALAKSKNCLGCHSVDHKIVGPAYKDVAAKYAGKAGAEATLANAIMKGSSGVWGGVPMPANPQVNAGEAKELAEWILSMKK